MFGVYTTCEEGPGVVTVPCDGGIVIVYKGSISSCIIFLTDIFETLPINPPIYRLGSIFFNGVEVERINEKEWAYRRSSILTHPKNSRPIYIPNGNGQISAFGDSIVDPIAQDLPCNYIRRPGRAQWGYMVVNGYAQYNITTSNDFELHASEETNLTLKILQLAGLVMKDVGLYQTMAQEEIKDIQQEKQ